MLEITSESITSACNLLYSSAAWGKFAFENALLISYSKHSPIATNIYPGQPKKVLIYVVLKGS